MATQTPKQQKVTNKNIAFIEEYIIKFKGWNISRI